MRFVMNNIWLVLAAAVGAVASFKWNMRTEPPRSTSVSTNSFVRSGVRVVSLRTLRPCACGSL